MMETCNSREVKLLPELDEKSEDAADDKKKSSVTMINLGKDNSELMENSESSKAPQKITHFFPILRLPNRVRIKTPDVNFEKAGSKDSSRGNISSSSSVTSSKEQAKYKEFLSQIPNKNLSNLLSTALKTSLSEVLRKNIEANNQLELNKEQSVRRGSSSKEKPAASKTADSLPKCANQTSTVDGIEMKCNQEAEGKRCATEKNQSSPVVAKEKDNCEQETLQNVAQGPIITQVSCSASDQMKCIKSDDVSVNAHGITSRLQNATKHSSKTFSSTLYNSSTTTASEHVTVQPEIESQHLEVNQESQSLTEKENETVICEEADIGCSVQESAVTPNKEACVNSSESLAVPLNDTAAKPRKSKKRHFKGATYRLYLTPARKKKKLQKKQHIDSTSKDDEMSLTSTENGSYLDSSDACSMFSDDFNTSSEKSLADDEACSNSRCSPLHLLSEQRIDISDLKVEPEAQNATTYSPVITKSDLPVNENPAVSVKIEIPDPDFEIPKNAPEETKDEEKSGEKLFPSMPDSDIKVSNDLVLEMENNSLDEISLTNIQIPEKLNLSTDCDNVIKNNMIARTTNTRKSASSYSTNLVDPTLASRIKLNLVQKHETVNLCKEKSTKATHDPTSILYTYSGSTDMDGNSYISSASPNSGPQPAHKEGDSSKTITLSTIATSVKSRQRMKRRFTDDIVDTDVGILSLNSMPSTCRKAKAELPPPPQTQDIIENFKISLNTEARGGPAIKTESVFSSKQDPVGVCTCRGDTFEVKLGEEPANFYCQAVDTFEEKLVGCSSPVTTFRLVRPSVRIPFTVMCEMHIWRMKQHHCCPRCGVFCTQGPFVQCTADSRNASGLHLFHERCRGITEEGKFDFCLHCGSDSTLKSIRLDCEMTTPPTFFQSQLSVSCPNKARITFSSADRAKEQEMELDPAKCQVSENDTVQISGGRPEDDMAIIEAMIASLKVQDISEMPDYPLTDLYTAASDGDSQKVLFMLAKGVNPNERFQEHDGSIALHASAASGHVVVTHLLLQAGSVADTINRNLRTPLMLATEKNHERVAERLLKGNAPLETKGEVGMTCLHLAARDGHFKLCKMFLDSGNARVNAQDDGGWTPIVWASEHGHRDIVNHLIKSGGDPNLRDNEGNTALHWAAFCGTVDVCTLLLSRGCILDEANEHGDTPMHVAARQDNFECIDLFLARNANLDVRNKAGELPIDCCINNPGCKSYQAINLNMQLRALFGQFNHKCERILSKDIALGRERYPIRCINGVDDADLHLKEFLYVTENCETCPIKIDRCITALQHCNCSDDCTDSTCTCSAISFKCWYDKDGHLLPEFNMLDPPLLFECNRACSCDVGICRNRVVQRGMTCRLELVRTIGRGWGVRTLKDIPKGTFICEYVGELITDSEADTRQDDSYLFDLDNKDGETYCLDARHFGNISRFINHLCEPNLVPVKVFIDHQDLSFPRIAFFSLRDIFQYEELGFDYGEKFWVIKSKSFTCCCESEKCKYSQDTIQETLENYNNRIREDLHEDINIYSV